MKPAISIVIPTKNGGDRFGEVLKRVYQQAINRLFEVIVIDSGSTDGTIATAKQYPLRLMQIKPEEFGHGRTRNLGAELAQGDYVVFLTQDAVPADENWLQSLIRNLKDPAVAGVFGRQLAEDKTDILQTYFLNDTYPDQREVKSLPGIDGFTLRNIFFSNVNSAVPKRILHKYPFNETLVMSEDQEWSKRVLMDGYQVVYEPQAAVYHWHNYSLISALRRNFDSGASLRGITQERVGHGIAYLTGYILGELAYALKGGRFWVIPRLLLYEASRTTGFLLGQQERLLPLWLKRQLGWHRYYWGGQARDTTENVRALLTNAGWHCELCGNSEAQVLYAGRDRFSSRAESEPYSVMRCTTCGLIALTPQPSPDELAELYPETYSPFALSLTESPSRFRLFLRAITNIRRHRRVTCCKKGESILDIGCGTGDFLEKMHRTGKWIAKGLEPNEGAAAYARDERGLDVFMGELTHFRAEGPSFDVITLWDVLEHLPHPGDSLARVYELLKRNGLLIITVPNIGALEHTVFRESWFPLEIPRHLYHFTIETLTALLAKEGFRVLRYRTDPLDTYYTFLRSWGCLFEDRFASTDTVPKDMGSRAIRGGWHAIGLSMCLLLTPLFLIVALLRRGSILAVHARRAPGRG